MHGIKVVEFIGSRLLMTAVATQKGQENILAALVAGLTVTKGQQSVAPVVIPHGTSLSPVIDLGVARLVGISVPAGLTATSLTFQASYDGVTFNDLYSEAGTEKALTVGATARRIVLNPADFYGVRYLKVRSGTAAAPVNVTAARTFQLIAEA